MFWPEDREIEEGMDYWLIRTGPVEESVGGEVDKKLNPRDTPRNYIAVESIEGSIVRFHQAGESVVREKAEITIQSVTKASKSSSSDYWFIIQIGAIFIAIIVTAEVVIAGRTRRKRS